MRVLSIAVYCMHGTMEQRLTSLYFFVTMDITVLYHMILNLHFTAVTQNEEYTRQGIYTYL